MNEHMNGKHEKENMKPIYTYDTIKTMASTNGKRVSDYLALSIQNDPFYTGQKAEIERAKWFANMWDSGFLAGRSHIRGIHYFMISREESIIIPDGLPYENTDKCWAYLGAAVKAARYLGLVDVRAFKDRRSQPAQIFTEDAAMPFVDIGNDYYFDLELPAFPDLPVYQLNDFTGTQKYMTEVWIEKSTMEDELLPLCHRYGCNLVTGVGELSITQCILLLDRIIRYKRPCRVLYVSDFDPAGRSMPVSVSRKIEFYQRNQYPDLDIQVQQVALTHEQCQKYKLPRTPIKESERRASKFEALYGEGATELDALEALYPGELTRIVRKELERFYDDTLSERCFQAAWHLRNEMKERRDNIASQYEDQISKLEDQYDNIKNRFAAEVSALSEQVEGIWQAIHEEMTENRPAEVYTPEAQIEQDKEWDAPLYSSDRDYAEQLDHYQKFKGAQIE